MCCLRYAVITLLVLGSARSGTAHAQHCHDSAPLEEERQVLRVMVGGELATFRTSRYEGRYEGLSVRAVWQHPRVYLSGSLPAYHLTRNGLDADGLGDLSLTIRVPVVGTHGDRLAGGLLLTTSAPTGDASRDLGMGHVMVMSGVWASWRSDSIFVAADAAYGRSLTATLHAHHGSGGPAPIVNPMNPSEIASAVSGGVRLHERIRVRSGVYGAVPIAVSDGRGRGVAFGGADVRVDWFELSLEGQIPFVGDPFIGKVLLAMSARL